MSLQENNSPQPRGRRKGFAEGNATGRQFAPGNTASKRHGHTGVRPDGRVWRSPTYQSWRSMKARCYDDNHPWWHAYGERGITVCARWLGRDGFANFLADMGVRPSKELTLDRERVNENYNKDNCRWATKTVQRLNVRPLPTSSNLKARKAAPKRSAKASKSYH